MKKALIIGGGIAGCAAAHQLTLANSGWQVDIVEAAPFLGAGNRTFWYGGHPYTFGPRHFLTQNETVYEYFHDLIPLRPLDHEFVTYVEKDNQFYNYPIHMADVARMPDAEQVREELAECERRKTEGVIEAKNLEEYWVQSVGRSLFNKFIDGYNKKMWQVDDCKEIDTFGWSPKGAALKDGPREGWTEAISAYPWAHDGYNKYFDISTEGCQIHLKTRIEDYDIEKKRVRIDGEDHVYDLIVSTISPDILLNSAYGELPYIGRDIHLIVFPTEFVMPGKVFFLYYANDEKFTRLVEYKKFTLHRSHTTLVGMEIPSTNGKHYPLPFKSEQVKANKYFDAMPDGVYSMGRSGSYLYGHDIDDCIWQAMKMVEQVEQGGQDHPVPGPEYRHKV